MRRRQAIILGGLLGAAAGWCFAGVAGPPLEIVAHVDLNRYTGRWYEIARYQNWFERKCDRDVTAQYSIKENGDIRVVNSCVGSSGAIHRSEGNAKVVDTTTNAKLKVAFFWLFYGKYWIIDLGSNYEYAVVGEPSREYLWILNRSASMPDAEYREITDRLRSKGFDPSRLVKTPQTMGP